MTLNILDVRASIFPSENDGLTIRMSLLSACHLVHFRRHPESCCDELDEVDCKKRWSINVVHKRNKGHQPENPGRGRC